MALALRLYVSTASLSSEAINFSHDSWKVSNQISQFFSQDGNRNALFAELSTLRANVGLIYALFLIPFSISFLIFGVNLSSSILIPILFSSLLLYIVYKLGAVFFNRKIGLMAALIWGLLPIEAHFASSSLLSNPFLAFALGAFMLIVWAFRKSSRFAFGLGLLGLLFIFISFPFLGISLLVLILGIFYLQRISDFQDREKSKNELLKILLIFSLLANLFFVSIARATWDLYTRFLGRPEIIILAPLFLFAMYSLAIYWRKGSSSIFLVLVYGYLNFLGIHLFPSKYAFIANNTEGISLLLFLLPLVFVAAMHFTKNLSYQETIRLISLAAAIVFFTTIWVQYSQIGEGASSTQIVQSFSQISAGLLFILLIIQPIFVYPPILGWKLLMVKILVFMFSIAMFFFISTPNVTIPSLDSNIREMLNRNDKLKIDQSVYICPGVLRLRFWFFQGFAPDENPYRHLPDDLSQIDEGFAVVHKNCRFDNVDNPPNWKLVEIIGDGQQSFTIYQFQSQ